MELNNLFVLFDRQIAYENNTNVNLSLVVLACVRVCCIDKSAIKCVRISKSSFTLHIPNALFQTGNSICDRFDFRVLSISMSVKNQNIAFFLKEVKKCESNRFLLKLLYFLPVQMCFMSNCFYVTENVKIF